MPLRHAARGVAENSKSSFFRDEGFYIENVGTFHEKNDEDRQMDITDTWVISVPLRYRSIFYAMDCEVFYEYRRLCRVIDHDLRRSSSSSSSIWW